MVAHLLKDRHVVPGGEQLDILGHMAKIEALIISASIINTDVLQLLLIVGYFPMQKLVELSNLLIYNLLLKFSFRFCPLFVHENINLLFRGNFFI